MTFVHTRSGVPVGHTALDSRPLCDCTGATSHVEIGTDGRGNALLTIHRDGRVEAPSVEAASEAGRVFVETIRTEWVA